MASGLSFEAALEAVQQRQRQRPAGGAVRVWRLGLSVEDRSAFDAAVDNRARISTADLRRAVCSAGGQGISYKTVYVYRESVLAGAQR